MIATPPSSGPGPPTPPQSPKKYKSNSSRSNSVRDGSTGSESKKGRKLGHRRVTDEGTVTYKKKPTSEIQRAIQLGIQHQIGRVQQEPTRDVLFRDFQTIETVSFPSSGSRTTPAHALSEFRFRTFAPIAFRNFRDRYKLDIRDFLHSLCGEELRELSNPGASGSIFYITEDDEFIIKTVQRRESDFLQALLPHYFINLMQHPCTLLPKFYGFYCYQTAAKNIRFVIMNNLLPSSVRIHEKYDLKGSLYKRRANARELAKSSPTLKDLDFRERHPEGIWLEADTFDALLKAIEQDCLVLNSLKIMDYSLLLGVHNMDEAKRTRLTQSKENSVDDSAAHTPHDTASGGDEVATSSPDHLALSRSGLSSNGNPSLQGTVSSRAAGAQSTATSPRQLNTSRVGHSSSRSGPTVTFVQLPGADGESLGVNVYQRSGHAEDASKVNSRDISPMPVGSSAGPATTSLQRGVRKAKSQKRLAAYCTAMESIAASAKPVDLDQDELDLIPSGGIFARSSNGERLLLFIGIIDILQSYRLSKRLEHGFKALAIDAETISVTPPSFYSLRFQESLARSTFKQIPCPMKQQQAASIGTASSRRTLGNPHEKSNRTSVTGDQLVHHSNAPGLPIIRR